MSKYYKHIIVFFLLFFSIIVNAQNLGNPKLGFNYACAQKNGFNSFNITVSYSGYTDAQNHFILELSDEKGSFVDKGKIKELKKIKATGTSSSLNFNFAFPEGVFGEQYRVRVRSTHPEKESALSKKFTAYLLPSGRPKLNNGEYEVLLCGNNATKEIEITFDDETIDPATYKYIWYKNGQEFKEGTNKLVISEIGTYNAKISLNKGCTNIDDSNLVEAKVRDAVEVFLNSKETEVALCSNENYSFKANVVDKSYKYRWYKDKKVILDTSYSPEFTTENQNQFGVYYLILIAPNGCELKTQEITLKGKAADYEVSIQGEAERTVAIGGNIELLSNVSVENSAYTYQWFKDETLLQGKNQANLTTSETGEYFVQVSKAEGECSVSAKSAVVVVRRGEGNVATVVPNVLSPFNADGINDTWVLPSIYANKSDVRVVIYNSAGKEIFSQQNYQNNWPEKNIVKAGALYYFKIFQGNEVKKSGTISVVE